IAAASQNSDDRVSATINLGRLYQKEGDYAEAESQFSTAIARDPKAYAAFVGRAVARESAGNLEGAAEDYLAAVKLDPTNSAAHLGRGVVMASRHRRGLGRRCRQRRAGVGPAGYRGAKARLLLENQALKTP